MSNLFEDTLIEDFAEYLNDEEDYDINCDDDYIEYIDRFVDGIYWSDLQDNYIIGNYDGADIDGMDLFLYIRETDIDLLEYITEYMKDDKNNACYIREALVKMCINIFLRNEKEKVVDMYIDKYINK
tara:strand:+ start:113 stop:493 length:381 start_codon:yes stop_codon:yes gene_type:complete